LGALWFGPAAGEAPRGRFDDPARGDGPVTAHGGPTFGVCYLGLSAEAAFAESFLRRPGVRLVSRATFDARAVSEVRVLRALRLVAFHGPGLAALGATAAVAHGPHAAARRWARALWAHPDQPDGIAYRCRHDDDDAAVALFDRAAGRARGGRHPRRARRPRLVRAHARPLPPGARRLIVERRGGA
jgi:hypothetical protein